MSIDWSTMSGKEILVLLENVPIVMQPWQSHGKALMKVGKEETFSRFSDARLGRLWGDTKHAFVQRTSGWAWTLGHDYRTGFTTAADAIADVDREMQVRGWKLIGETIR